MKAHRVQSPAAAIVADLRVELAGGSPTGMRPVDDNGTLSYTQTWEIAVASRA